MTEDEAKTKWCPFVRMEFASQQKDIVFYNNRGDAGDGLKEDKVSLLCIGSQCMAWRWLDQQTYADVMNWVHAEAGRKIEDFTPQNPTQGYCGLAGDKVLK